MKIAMSCWEYQKKYIFNNVFDILITLIKCGLIDTELRDEKKMGKERNKEKKLAF